MARQTRFLTSVGVVLGMLTSCSIINSFDEVKPASDAGGSVGGSGGQAGSDGAAGSAGSSGQAGTAGADNGGLIVMAGTDSDTKTDAGGTLDILSVLDTSGNELHRDVGVRVTAAAYDGAREYWYLLIQPAPPTPTTEFHVRSFDRAQNKWVDIGKTAAEPLLGGETLVPLNNRVAYLSTEPPNTIKLTVVDTSDPYTPKLLAAPLTLSGAVSGLVGFRNKDPKVIGAGVNLMRQSCGPSPEGGTACAVLAQPYTIDTQITPTATNTTLATVPTGTNTVWGPDDLNDRMALVLPPPAGGAADTSQIRQYDPQAHTGVGLPVNFVSGGTQLRSVVVEPCQKVALVGELSDPKGRAVFAVPLETGGTVAEYHPPGTDQVQRVVYEPITKTVIVPFRSGQSFAVHAATLGGTTLAPTLVQRTDFKSPPDLRPGDVIAVKQQYPPPCP